LHDYVKVFEGVMLDDEAASFMWYTDDAYEEAAGRYVFKHAHGKAAAISAVVPRRYPYFIHHTPFTDTRGRILLDHTNMDIMWATFCITASGNRELAWEFLRHLTYAMSFPVPEAQYNARGMSLWFGTNNFGTPVIREFYEPHIRNTFHYFMDLRWPPDATGVHIYRDMYVGMDDDNARADALNRIVSHRAAQNEAETALLKTLLPWQIYSDPLDQLLRGVITPEVAAQRLQNMIALWLMEQ
jgi:hypothetical protein